MTKDEALKLALDALEDIFGKNKVDVTVINVIKEALAQPEQEPVAWISTGPARMIHWTSDKPAYGDDWIPLYTTPPQRTWVGLTDEELSILGESFTHPDEGIDEVDFGMEIQRILKEKNT